MEDWILGYDYYCVKAMALVGKAWDPDNRNENSGVDMPGKFETPYSPKYSKPDEVIYFFSLLEVGSPWPFAQSCT